MRTISVLCMLFISASLSAQKAAPKPLYDDPVYHGAADPVIIYNKQRKTWWMLYTNRRAAIDDTTVQWVHGTRIGIAESKDGREWKYKDTANINYRPDEGYTHWAPDVIEHKGIFHMYLTYVPGTFSDWNHPREIVHLTSSDLLNWQYESTLKLVNQKVIDASVFKLPDGTWRMWYNNEKDGKSIYYADSKDLYNWVDKGKAIAARGEGPKTFRFKNKYWMIVDVWKGMELYYSDDLLKWTKQSKRILEEPGKGTDDQAIGGHCDVVINNDRAYVFYFTHPGRRKDNQPPKNSFDQKRSVIQLAELHYANGEITCDRDEPVMIKLKSDQQNLMSFNKQYRFFRKGIYVLLIAVLICNGANAQVNNISVTGSADLLSFPVISNKLAASFYYDNNDATVVGIAAKAFKNDVIAITGKEINLVSDKNRLTDYTIVAGTIGHSSLIDELINRKHIAVSSIKGKWESFKIAVINQPGSKTKKYLIIAGSDYRGTAFGIFHLSRLMGVSPFVWWADVVPQRRKQLFISGNYTSSAPSVKYRGIFINDEDWGLQPWAAKTFEPEIGDIGPKTYAKVFELLLRLRANLIWPAMHPSTKAFFQIPGNAKVAQDYAMIIGSSHAEPMLRNNVGEWNEKTMGHFNYISNKETVYKYWEDRVKESSGINAMYSMGMRGVHDSKMEGVKDSKEAVPLLENIFRDQRQLLTQYINKDVTAIPQVFTAYKEVLEIYDNGLQLPDDVTLVWPDDNYGYIQRLNNENEMTRPGGSGVYYHASYWGRPHDYLWISSTHPALMQEEMMKAFENGSNRLWVLNVGDIKPLEYNTEVFLDMAYDAIPFKNNRYAKQHLQKWLSSMFGKAKAQTIQPVMWEYYQLAYERRPEFMGWSQTEPTTKTNYSTFNHFYYGDEAQKRIDRYQALENKVKALRTQMLLKDAASFYQLVYYPVVGASLMNKKFLYRDKSYFYAKQNRLSAFDYAQQSKAAYDRIIAETEYFNNKLSGGKWKNMMSMQPRNLPVFLTPELPTININRSTGWSIAPEGYITKDSSLLSNNKEWQLPEFDKLNKQQYFIDLFLTDNKTINWTASASAAGIKLSTTKGTLSDVVGKKQVRVYVTVDWSKVPGNETLNGQIRFEADGKQIAVTVYGINRSLNNFKGFVENNGYVSIHPAHYNRQKKQAHADWILLPDLGYAGEALQSQTVSLKNMEQVGDTGWIKKSSSYVEYDFYTFSTANAALTVFSVPTHPLNNRCSMRYAVSVDDGPLQVVDFRTFGRSDEWKQNVLRNRAEKKIKLPLVEKGKHRLRIYAVDPGVILDGILIDLGGLHNACAVIPETKPYTTTITK